MMRFNRGAVVRKEDMQLPDLAGPSIEEINSLKTPPQDAQNGPTAPKPVPPIQIGHETAAPSSDSQGAPTVNKFVVR